MLPINKITFFLLVLTCIATSSPLMAQNNSKTWQEESTTNKRLLPRYGPLPKTQKELSSDSAFIADIMSQPQFKSRTEASQHMIGLGFQYYGRSDLKTAFYRFNQAYLLDSTNTDIFWGYGAVYMALGLFEKAKEQYETGLAMNSKNPHLLTDYATYYMNQYYIIAQMPANNTVKDPEAAARPQMDSAISYLVKSFDIDPKDQNTTYKLSICYWNISDCTNAWKFYDITVGLGGRPITESYTKDLEKRCKRN